MSRELVSRPYTTWQLIRSYWQSDQRLSAYLFLIAVLVMTIGLVGIEVAFNTWYNYFYTALQDYNKRAAYDLIVIFIFMAAVNIVVVVYRYYLQSFLALRWRRWLTEQFLDRWLSGRSYYYLENFDKETDNPDQRIQEDINALVSNSLSLLVGLISSIITIPTFIYILWRLSGILTIPLGSMGTLQIPGYLAWVGIIYAVIGTILTFKIGRPLVMLNFEQQRREANFRFGAIDVRVHAENIALYRGEHHQKTVLNVLLEKLLGNFYLIILRQKILYWFMSSYSQIAVLLPLLVVMPNYFNRIFKLGDMMQALKAFGSVHDSLSFFISAYITIAEWKAINQRLITFLNHMYEIDQDARAEDHFSHEHHLGSAIVVDHMNLTTPDHHQLLNNISQKFVHGKNYWIKGKSGIGKSTFVRALADIWPYGSGQMQLPEHQSVMFIPQKPYMPLGTLKEALLFPDNVRDVDDNYLKQLLEKVGLQRLTARLHEVSMWSYQLSPGEQQRIGFVRILIHKPDWVFLDESTSALDLMNERKMYELLKTELPGCSFISVGHRTSLADYHEETVDFEQYAVRA